MSHKTRGIDIGTLAANTPVAADQPSRIRRDWVRKALLIRKCEERLLSLFSEGKLYGTVHTCIGQEWTGVSVCDALRQGDSVFSNHRGHGHFLARTGDINGLIAEVMGRISGVCGGMGGSQHLYAENYYSNGIQGGMVPIAAGKALAAKMDGKGAVSVVFIGDGTLGEGTLYEAMNIASKWQLPLLIVLENNRYAQSTSQLQTLAGKPSNRALAFDIEYRQGDTWDWQNLMRVSAEAVDFARTRQKPVFLEINTYRLKAHSKGDDNRDPAEVKDFLARDFLSGIIENPGDEWRSLIKEVDEEVEEAVRLADAAAFTAPWPEPETVSPRITWQERRFEKKRMGELLYAAFLKLFQEKPETVLIGEDIEGPYGGAFKISRDLSQLFPGRVRNTPISEAAITGIGTGLALGGYAPMVEIMFGDFLTLTLDQLLQHASKFRRMYNSQVRVPLIVRTPMGGKRGYGPTHSQSIEKHFLGIPDLQVVALNLRLSPEVVYEALAGGDIPALVIENKILYTRFLDTDEAPGFSVLFSDERLPTVRIAPQGSNPDVTVFCYGGTLEDVQKAVWKAFDQDEICCEIICPTLIHPLNAEPVLASVRKSGRLLCVEEGPSFAALGSELIARVAEAKVPLVGCKRIGFNSIIPSCGPLELTQLPHPESIQAAIKELFHG
jgi:2-oxoisovalerate dehydrogenase E1 component